MVLVLSGLDLKQEPLPLPLVHSTKGSTHILCVIYELVSIDLFLRVQDQ
jgi:hypothetical protein